MTDKPVVVYGASGYTGRLICEYLRDYNLPFVAAGRDKGKLQDAMSGHVAGIETADYEIEAVEHDVDALAELFAGASVVCNTVGPFSKLGPVVVEACLKAGVHYLDTTGEQDWLITCDEKYGADFAAAGLLLAPGVAQMYTTGEIAAQLVPGAAGPRHPRHRGVLGRQPDDRLDADDPRQRRHVGGALPRAEQLRASGTPSRPLTLVVPGQHELALALPWGGTSHPVWFKRDPRVANVRALGGVFNRALMLGVPQIVARRARGDQGHGAGRAVRRAPGDRGPGHEPDAARGRTPGSTSRSTPCTPPARSAGRTASSTATRTTSRPACSRRTRRTRCSSSRPSASGSPRAARRSGTASCSGCCAAYGLVMEPVSPWSAEVRLVEYLEKGASLGPGAPCLTVDGVSTTYAEVVGAQRAGGLGAWWRAGSGPGDTVAILSANDPVAFTSVFGISRAGAVWCPVNPRNEAAENRELLDLFDCRALVFQASFAGLVEKIRDDLPGVHTWVCLDGDVPGALGWDEFLALGEGVDGRGDPVDDVAMIVGTGGTTGRPKGVVLTGSQPGGDDGDHVDELPVRGRPVYLALAPLTHAAGVLCFPVLSLGGEVVVMRAPDVRGVPRPHRAARRHAYLPAADTDLHGAGPPGARQRGSLVVGVLLVRRGPDVDGPAGGGAAADRAGHGPAVRPDRGADDDLDAAAAGPLPTRRFGRDRAALVGRPAEPAGDGGGHGSGR